MEKLKFFGKIAAAIGTVIGGVGSAIVGGFALNETLRTTTNIKKSNETVADDIPEETECDEIPDEEVNETED